MPMARKKQQNAKTKNRKKRTPSVVPKPPPRAIAPRRKKKSSDKSSLSTRAKAQIKELSEALDKKQTKAVHVAAGVGGAVGCTLTGAYIVSKGWMRAKWASALLSAIGAGATFAGWYYDKPLVLWSGSGWTCAGAAHTTMAVVVDTRRAAKEKKAKAGKGGKPRNAASDSAERNDNDISRRLRLSEHRAKELELELTRARQRLNPEAELAAA